MLTCFLVEKIKLKTWKLLPFFLMEDEQVQTDFMQLWNWDKLNSTTSNKWCCHHRNHKLLNAQPYTCSVSYRHIDVCPVRLSLFRTWGLDLSTEPFLSCCSYLLLCSWKNPLTNRLCPWGIFHEVWNFSRIFHEVWKID